MIKVQLYVLISMILLNTARSADAQDNGWSSLDTAFENLELCQAFQDQEIKRYERTSCYASKCDKWVYLVNIHCNVQDATASLAFTKASDKKQFSLQKITSQTWEAAGRNLLRLKAQNVESFGQKFTLTSVGPTSLDSTPLTDNLIRAEYKIESTRPGGQVAVVGDGYWVINPHGKTTSDKVLKKVHTTYAIGKEVNTDQLIDAR